MAHITQASRRTLHVSLVAAVLVLIGTPLTLGQPAEHVLSGGTRIYPGNWIPPYDNPPPPASEYPEGWLAAGDFDGDGDRDIYAELEYPTSRSLGQNRSVLENLDGTAHNFRTHATPFITREPERVFPDINGDGYDDMLFLGNDLQWGAFVDEGMVQFPVFGGITNEVIPIDWDFDSDIDLVALHSGDATRWHENSGGLEPTFTDHVLFDNPVWGMAFGDLDGDQRMDFVQASGEDIVWHRNLGGEPPVFGAQTLLESDNLGQLKVRDMDLDGDPDVLSIVEGDLIWLENSEGDATQWVMHIIDDADHSEGTVISDVQIELNGFLSPVIYIEWYFAHQFTKIEGESDDWHREEMGPFRRENTGVSVDRFAVEFDDLDNDKSADALTAYCGLYALTFPAPGTIGYYPYITEYHMIGTASWWDSNPSRVFGTASLKASGEWPGYHSAGEQGLLHLNLHREGTKPLTQVVITPECESGHVIFTPPSITVPTFAVGASLELTLPYHIAGITECGEEITVNFLTDDKQVYADIEEVNTRVGSVTEVTFSQKIDDNRIMPAPPDALTWDFVVDTPPTYHVLGSMVNVQYHDCNPYCDLRNITCEITEPDGTTHGIPSRAEYYSRLWDFVDLGPHQPGIYTVRVSDSEAKREMYHVTLTINFEDIRCDEFEFSSDDLLLQILGYGEPNPAFDYNLDGRVDSSDLVWALSRGY